MDVFYNSLDLTINMETQYHIGSGFGLARFIDALLKVDGDVVPVVPGSTVSGIVGQGIHDLLRYPLFGTEMNKLCVYHNHTEADQKPYLPCGIYGKNDPCLLCYFMGSKAEDGVINWMDFKCVSDPELLRPMLKSGKYTVAERKQYIKPYASHKQNMRTGTVMEKHFFTQEEGGKLQFDGILTFKEPLAEDKARLLAAALANVRAVGKRKNRGKGECKISGSFMVDGGTGPAKTIDSLIEELFNEKSEVK